MGAASAKAGAEAEAQGPGPVPAAVPAARPQRSTRGKRSSAHFEDEFNYDWPRSLAAPPGVDAGAGGGGEARAESRQAQQTQQAQQGAATPTETVATPRTWVPGELHASYIIAVRRHYHLLWAVFCPAKTLCATHVPPWACVPRTQPRGAAGR